MSDVISFEVSRGVMVGPDKGAGGFVSEITALGRNIFDTEGVGAVSIRPSDIAVRTVKAGIVINDEFDLRYHHAMYEGLDTKRLGKKLHGARVRLGYEDDCQATKPFFDNSDIEERAGHEPLARTFERIQGAYAFDTLPDIECGSIDAVEAPLTYPGETLFVLRPTEGRDMSPESMYRHMTFVANLALSRTVGRLKDLERIKIEDGIVIARTRKRNKKLIADFQKSVADILPVVVMVDGVTTTAKL